MSHPAFLLAIVAAILIAWGRLAGRLPVAIVGFVLLVLALLAVLVFGR
jgi:hypothetical protein